jgi:hypothetical protein
MQDQIYLANNRNANRLLVACNGLQAGNTNQVVGHAARLLFCDFRIASVADLQFLRKLVAAGTRMSLLNDPLKAAGFLDSWFPGIVSGGRIDYLYF